MSLKQRKPDIEAVAMQAARMAYRIVHKQYATDGTVQAQAKGGDMLQQEDLDRLLPYGFYSEPPADSESVAVPCEGADVTVGERVVKPGDVPTGAGQGTIYASDGGYVQCENGGDVVAGPQPGKFMLIGKGATEFVAMANLVLAELQQIKTDYDAHIHNDPLAGVTGAPTVPMTAPSAVAATVGKVE